MAITKRCEWCGAEMVVWVDGYTQDEYLGCERAPACKYREDKPEDRRLRQMGAAELPGLE